MGLEIKNNYLLLEPVVDASSQFVSEGAKSSKYKIVHTSIPEYKEGGYVYMRDTLGKIKVEDKEYELAEDSEVIAYVA